MYTMARTIHIDTYTYVYVRLISNLKVCSVNLVYNSIHGFGAPYLMVASMKWICLPKNKSTHPDWISREHMLKVPDHNPCTDGGRGVDSAKVQACIL